MRAERVADEELRRRLTKPAHCCYNNKTTYRLVPAAAASSDGSTRVYGSIEQMLYEVHDPSAYLTPDVQLDITDVTLIEDGKDRIRVTGAKGSPPPETLKVTVSADGGWLAESEMIYAGPNALARARLAADVVRSRVRKHGVTEKVRVEIVGTGAVYDNDASDRERQKNMPMDGEYRLRSAVRTLDKATAQYVNDEVLSLFCSGPAGGGGVRAADGQGTGCGKITDQHHHQARF